MVVVRGGREQEEQDDEKSYFRFDTNVIRFPLLLLPITRVC